MNTQLARLRLVWFAIAGSVIMYVAVPNITSTTAEITSPGVLPNPEEMIEIILAFMALISLVMSSVVPKLLAKSNPQDTFVPFVVRMALLDTIALNGFIIATLSHNPAKIWIFAAVALLGMIKAYPTDQVVA